MNKKYNKNYFYVLSFLFPLGLFLKIFQYIFFPSKYFIDSNYILKLINININLERYGSAFYNTALIFKFINVFNFVSLKQWSYFLYITFTIICFLLLLRYKSFSIFESVFILASYSILNLYSFNLSKDIIQFVFFICIYLTILSSKNNTKKITIILLLLIFESIFFRPYYVLIAVLLFIFYFVFTRFKTDTISKRMVKSLFIWVIFLLISKIIFPSHFESLIFVRNQITDMLSANTEINNIFNTNSGNITIFFINYCLNGIRILFPIELIFHGIRYLPFVIYQFMFSYIIIGNLRKVDEDNLVPLILIISYLLVSFIFEPDFGSVVRHESALFIILIYLNSLLRRKND